MRFDAYNHVDLENLGPELEWNADQREGMQRVLDWFHGSPRGVYLYGPVGTGKTTIARRVGVRLRERGRDVLFLKTTRFLNELRDFDDRSVFADLGASASRERAMNAPWLILDDLGAERDTAYAIEELCALLKHRYDERETLSTLITSNLTGAEVKARYGARLYSPLSGLCSSVEVPGKDLRRA